MHTTTVVLMIVGLMWPTTTAIFPSVGTAINRYLMKKSLNWRALFCLAVMGLGVFTLALSWYYLGWVVALGYFVGSPLVSGVAAWRNREELVAALQQNPW